MSKALKPFGVECLISLGSGSIDLEGESWRYWEDQDQKYILFDKSLFIAKRYCNAMRIAATAAKFYKKNLAEIINNIGLAGVIVYSPQYQLIAPFFSVCKMNKVFLIADCIENFSLSFKYLLNGVIYQQFKFRVFQMRRIDGAIIQSPRWLIDTKNANIPSIMIPGFLDSKDCFRESASLNSGKLKITIMGRFMSREMPSVLIKALRICNQNKLSFEVNIVGSGKGGWVESYWLKKLVNIFPNTGNDLNIRGYVSNSARDEILAATDIFIMLRPPSKEIEYIYPSRVSEFLNSGNPVILTDTSALNEFFHQELGVYFISSKNDSTELAQLIMDLADKPLERFESGKKGRIYAMNNFSLKVMGKKLSDFINVINNKY